MKWPMDAKVAEKLERILAAHVLMKVVVVAIAGQLSEWSEEIRRGPCSMTLLSYLTEIDTMRGKEGENTFMPPNLGSFTLRQVSSLKGI